MYQIDNPSAVAVQPSATAMGAAGWFSDGNPAGGIPATIVPAEWLNAVQAELINAVEAAGITPQKGSYNQLAQAIQTLGRNYEQINIGGSGTTALTSAQAGTFLISLVGVLTGNATVVVPNLAGAWVFQNSASGSYTVTVKTVAGTGVQLLPGTSNALWSDGINVYAYQSTPGQYGAVTPLSVSTALTTANLGQLMPVTVAATTQTLPPLALCPAGAMVAFAGTYAIGSASTTVKGNATELIAGTTGTTANTFVFNAGESVTFVSNGSRWNVVAYTRGVAFQFASVQALSPAANGTLSNVDLGALTIVAGAGGTTQTLPPIASSPSGTVLTLQTQYVYGSLPTTVAGSGTDLIADSGGTKFASFVMQAGCDANFVSDGTRWNLVGFTFGGQFGTSITSTQTVSTATTVVPGTEYILAGTTGVALTVPALLPGQVFDVVDVTLSNASTLVVGSMPVDGKAVAGGSLTIDLSNVPLHIKYINSTVGLVIK